MSKEQLAQGSRGPGAEADHAAPLAPLSPRRRAPPSGGASRQALAEWRQGYLALIGHAGDKESSESRGSRGSCGAAGGAEGGGMGVPGCAQGRAGGLPRVLSLQPWRNECESRAVLWRDVSCESRGRRVTGSRPPHPGRVPTRLVVWIEKPCGGRAANTRPSAPDHGCAPAGALLTCLRNAFPC